MKLKIEPPNYVYCPFCGQELKIIDREGKTRKICGGCNWTYYPFVYTGAGAVIVRDGKILLVKRNKEPYKDTWMFPAGFIEFGELPEDAIIRELREEAGAEVESMEFYGLWNSENDVRCPGSYLFVYTVKLKDGEIKNNDPHENGDIGWFDLNNPPEIGWRVHREIIKRLQKNL